MGGAHFDMSAPDIKDKPEKSSNQISEINLREFQLPARSLGLWCTIPNKVADRVADEWM